MKLLSILLLLSLSLCSYADDKPKAVTPSDAALNKILKAQHSLDDVQNQLTSLQARSVELQNQWTQMQQQYSSLQSQQVDKKKAYDEAVDEAFKAADVDKAKYDWNKQTYQFDPKASPAPPTTAPEKK